MPAALRPAAQSVGGQFDCETCQLCPGSIALARTTFENARSAETLMPQESQYCWHLRRLLRGEWHSGVPDWRCLARPDRLGASGIRREPRAVCRTSAVHPAPADGSDTPSAARHSRSVDRQTRRSFAAAQHLGCQSGSQITKPAGEASKVRPVGRSRVNRRSATDGSRLPPDPRGAQPIRPRQAPPVGNSAVPLPS